MITLYVSTQASLVRRTHHRLVVEREGAVLQQVRLRELERLVLIGNVQLTGPAMTALLDSGVETVLLSPTGRFRGRLAPAEPKNVFLRRAQFRRLDEAEFRLGVARAIVAGKVRNARTVLQRHHWNHPDTGLETAIRLLDQRLKAVPAADSLATLLGVEGEAARLYFGGLERMVRSELPFRGRSRRPPRDPVNALLSFGYSVLASELTGALAGEGLDPHVGILHELDYGRPSLALDLLEELRQPVVDRLVLSLVNRGVLQAEHFEDRGERGVFLNDSGRPRFLEFYHRALDAEFREERGAEPTTFRAVVRRQARQIRTILLEGGEYRPFAAS